MDDQVTIRFMTEADIESVLVVEHDAFTVPWPYSAFYNELTSNQFAHYLVLEVNGNITGYCGLWVVLGEAQITNIAIHSAYRGKKYGELLLREVLHLATMYGAETLSLEVRVSNNVAQNLYKKLGFQQGGIRRNYYSDNNEDAIVMWVTLNGEK